MSYLLAHEIGHWLFQTHHKPRFQRAISEALFIKELLAGKTIDPILYQEKTTSFVGLLLDIEKDIRSVDEALSLLALRIEAQICLQLAHETIHKEIVNENYFLSRELEKFIQKTVWVEELAVPILVLWAWIKTVKDSTAFLQNLKARLDKLLYQLGVTIAEWLASFLPKEMAGDLRELQSDFSRNGEPNLIFFLRVFGASLIRVWAVLLIWLQEQTSSEEERVVICLSVSH